MASPADPAPPPTGFTYELPPELIAQQPPAERDGARMLVVRRRGDVEPVHSAILALPRWLARGDLLVVNRSRVIAARLRASRSGGGAAEVLLIAPTSGDADAAAGDGGGPRWRALVRPAKRLRPGQVLALLPPRSRAENGDSVGEAVAIRVCRLGDGEAVVEFPPGTDVLALLSRLGEPPLPPYIRRPAGATADDRVRYQTVYAAEPGSIAAPTAGLHLSERVLRGLGEAGVEVAEIVLHVGPATFLAGRPGRAPLAVEPERYVVPPETRERVRAAREAGRRVVAVGTTTTRALESAARAGWPDGEQSTSLVLAPGATFEVVGGLLTNFHLPGSSLLALVSAFAGVEQARRAYAVAVAARYRFYSYGDAMLVL